MCDIFTLISEKIFQLHLLKTIDVFILSGVLGSTLRRKKTLKRDGKK
jgi:hypothetical protein